MVSGRFPGELEKRMFWIPIAYPIGRIGGIYFPPDMGDSGDGGRDSREYRYPSSYRREGGGGVPNPAQWQHEDYICEVWTELNGQVKLNAPNSRQIYSLHISLYSYSCYKSVCCNVDNYGDLGLLCCFKSWSFDMSCRLTIIVQCHVSYIFKTHIAIHEIEICITKFWSTG